VKKARQKSYPRLLSVQFNAYVLLAYPLPSHSYTISIGPYVHQHHRTSVSNNFFHFLSRVRRSFRPAWRRSARVFRTVKRSQPLTFRGLLAIALSVIALQFFATAESDLIAYMLGGAIAMMVLVTVVTSLLVRRSLVKELQIESHFDRESLYSRSPVRAGLTVRNALLPPFFSVHLMRVFQHQSAHSREHVITGREAVRRLVDTVRFPHRGFWSLEHLNVSLRDALGFTEITSDVPSNASVEVSARNIQIRQLPIVAASSRSGDTLDEARERSGDLFDIKQYDPSDGIKRILWKVYAKTGSVVVRRPEPAIIPEGEVAVFLIANRFDDHVAGALQSYLEELEKNTITVLFGTDGSGAYRTSYVPAHQETTSTNTDLVASKPEQIQSMINRSVWSAHAGTGNDLETFFTALNNMNRVIRRVVVFAPENNTDWFDSIRNVAAAHHVALTIVLAPDSLDPAVDLDLKMQKSASQAPLWFKRVEKAFNPKSTNNAGTLLKTLSGTHSSETELLICERSA